MTTEHQNDFHIDLARLEEEWVRQPSLAEEYGRQLADARQEYDLAKRRLDVAEAEAERDIRTDPVSYGISKVTEGAIKAAVILDKRVAKASTEVIQSNHSVGIAEAAKNAIEHRKKALEGAVSLFIAQYYSKPKEPKSANKQFSQSRADSAFGGEKRKVK